MDGRTLLLLDALKSPGGAFLFELVRRGALIEDDLVDAVPSTSQSTANRRLRELGQTGLLIREPGARQQRHRSWSVSVVEPADAFLNAAMALTQAISEKEAADRAAAASELRNARKGRRGLELLVPSKGNHQA